MPKFFPVFTNFSGILSPSTMIDLLLQYSPLFIALAWGSLLLFVVSLAVIPWLVTKIPADYFQPQYRDRLQTAIKRSVAARCLAVIKNLLGATLVCLGVVMLVTPGQGLLTILIGLLLTDFPGKYALEQRLVAMPSVLNSLNWIRTKAGKPPLSL